MNTTDSPTPAFPARPRKIARTLALKGRRRDRRVLSLGFELDGAPFEKTYRYEDVDLIELERRFGRDLMEKLYFHIAALDALPLVGLRPERLDLGPFARFHTTAFENLWQTVLRRVGAQWRYENDLPDEPGPEFLSAPSAAAGSPVEIEFGEVEALCFVGGGKDSLVALKTLEAAGVSFSSLAYSHSIYGSADLQHALIDRLLDHARPRLRHRQHVRDEAGNEVWNDLQTRSGLVGSIRAETPLSILAALPVVLQHGYRFIVLGHERSADSANLRWDRTGEQVNHQWGKSLEAETLLGDYIRREFVSNVAYFSVLKPIHDVLIFHILKSHPEAVPATHSCNVKKPWCETCPKCVYVWLNYVARFPAELIARMFRRNLFDPPENRALFRQLLGLERHKPFECIGEIEETRLALELCRPRGLIGHETEIGLSEAPPFDLSQAVRKYTSVYADVPTIPSTVARRIVPFFQAASFEAQTELLDFAAARNRRRVVTEK